MNELPPENVIDWVRGALGCEDVAPRFSVLADGANARVHRVDGPAGPCVLKRYRAGCDTDRRFEDWCRRLDAMPAIVGVERFLGGRRFGDEACALFSFIPGRPASPGDNPLTVEQLDRLFLEVFPRLDEAGLLNRDLNLGNILTTPEAAGIIDLEYIDDFSPAPRPEFRHWLDSDDWLCPIPANKVSFEREGVGPYLEALVSQGKPAMDVLAWLTDYLAAGAPYHLRRAGWLSGLNNPELERAIRYENARAQALVAPSKEMVLAQAFRLQVYYDAFAHVLFVQWRGRPDISGYAGTHTAIRADADRFLQTADRLLAGDCLSAVERALLDMDRESVARMREALAGEALPPSPDRNRYAAKLREHFPDGMPTAQTLAAWLRADNLPDAFIPPDWAETLRHDVASDGGCI